MKGEDGKYEARMTAAEAADWFRQLADRIAGRPVDRPGTGLDDFDPAAVKKLKISLEPKGNDYHLRMKAKGGPGRQSTPHSPESPGRPDYKALKKRMKGSFKRIGEALGESRLPDWETMDSFMADSALMITYPANGDEFHPRYKAACAEFLNAFKAGDLAQTQARYNQIKAIKSDCHDRYK
jgi:XXXCH domain-containing protein